jgi:HEAT repeat protein
MRKRGQPEAVPLLVELATRETDDSVRSSIALALRDFQNERAVETLWTMCEEGPDDVRLPALQGLSRLGDERVIPIAVSWYQSEDRLKRTLAIFDLSLLQTPDGEKALANLIAAEPSSRRRASNRRTLRRARKWRSRHG